MILNKTIFKKDLVKYGDLYTFFIGFIVGGWLILSVKFQEFSNESLWSQLGRYEEFVFMQGVSISLLFVSLFVIVIARNFLYLCYNRYFKNSELIDNV